GAGKGRSRTRWGSAGEDVRLAYALARHGSSPRMWRPELPSRRAVLKYGLAVVVVCMGLAVALLLERYNFTGVADSLFLFYIYLAVWFARALPGLPALGF